MGCTQCVQPISGDFALLFKSFHVVLALETFVNFAWPLILN